ncbi:F-box/FBD/LRR-repeat protein At3g52680 [Linum perenne]
MADGKDRISELPDEILLCILCFLQPQEEAARTIAISKRWRSVWRSYPIVKYNRWEDLQEFCDASINRWFVELREFVHRFTRFEKVDLRLWVEVDEVRFEEDEVDRDVHPVSIKELDISTASSTLSDTDYRALFDGLFWACRPRLIVIFYEDFITWDELIEVFLSQCLRKDDEEEGFKGRCNWRRQLKDVKIETVRFEEEEVDHDMHPVPIKELEILTLATSSSDTDQRALLGGVFWACHPRLFFVSNNFCYGDFFSSNGLIEVFLSQYLRKDGGGRCNWQHQLKEVKIKTEGEDMEISEDVVAGLKHSKHVRVRLTWY